MFHLVEIDSAPSRGGRPHRATAKFARIVHRVALAGLPDADRQRRDLDEIVDHRLADGESCPRVLASVIAAVWHLAIDRVRDDVATAIPAGLSVAVVSITSLMIAFNPRGDGITPAVWAAHAATSGLLAVVLLSRSVRQGRRLLLKFTAVAQGGVLIAITIQFEPSYPSAWGVKASTAVLAYAFIAVAIGGRSWLPYSSLLAGITATTAAIGSVGVTFGPYGMTNQIAAIVMSVALVSMLWTVPRLGRVSELESDERREALVAF